MSIGAFIRRELVRSVRQGRPMRDRLVLALWITAILAGFAVALDRLPFDRTTVTGQAIVAMAALGLAAAGQVVATSLVAFWRIAPALGVERDRKSLDAVLSTRLTSAEIVLGTMAEGLLAAAGGLAATVPVIAIALAGRVDPRLVLLALAATAATAVTVAAFSIAASVESGTRDRALHVATGLITAWLFLPYSILMFSPFFKIRLPWWLVRGLLWAHESSPCGLLFSWLVPAMPRPGTPVDHLLRMIALEALVAGGLIAWAIGRLRPASRSLHDAEGRSLVRRMLRLSRLRLRPRTACGDDPVYWNEVNAGRSRSLRQRLEACFFEAAGLGMLAVGTSWFAVPAFAELAERGYRASREAFTMPDLNPLARVLVSKLLTPIGPPGPGTARLEFNSVLRQLTVTIMLIHIITLSALATQSVTAERTRDTWLGLLATPLSGREILLGKMRGAVRRRLDASCLLVGLWTLGLLSGAVHPLGFVAVCAVLAVANLAYPTLGVAQGLWMGVERARGNPFVVLLEAKVFIAGVVALTFAPSAMTWAALFTYEDVDAAVRGAALPEFSYYGRAAVGARAVVAFFLAATAAAAVGTAALRRRLYRDFDAVVGRPLRPASPPDPAAGS